MSSFLAFLYIAIKHTGLAIHREHSKQSMIMHLSDSHVRANIHFMMTHMYRGSIIVISISKSVEPNEEQKEMISGFQQGILCKH